MNIQSDAHYSTINTSSYQKKTSEKNTDSTANIANKVAISSTAQNDFTKHSHVVKATESSATATFNTSQGYKDLNIDALFSPADPSAVYSLQTLPPLACPY